MRRKLAIAVNPDAKREENDYYATDPNAMRIVVPLLKELGISNNIWECSCGEGHLSKVLVEQGFNVRSTDLINRGFGEVQNFLTRTEKWNGDILTNPPFKLAEEFVEKSMELLEDGNKAIFFLKVQFLESESRKKLFEKYNPKFVIVNSKRQQCAMNGDFEHYHVNTICYCWFIFEKGYKGDSKLLWV